MLSRIRPNMTYANVAATIALVIAVGGGGAYAAAKLKNNSVTSPKIRDGAVATADLAPGAVTPEKSSGLIASSAAGQFLPASAAGQFAPASTVQRISFRPTGCPDNNNLPQCNATVANFGGLTLIARCENDLDGAGTSVVSVDQGGAAAGVETNLALVHDNGAGTLQAPGTPQITLRSGAGSLLSLDGNPIDAVGTIVIRRGSSETITIPFHASADAGANCAFEGTATRA